MSLVSYASSDSDEENETNQNVTNHNCMDDFRGFPKKRETVKITIPSLKEFKDEEPDQAPKKKMVYQGGSSLFSILPPPKNSATLSKPGFTPYVLSKKQDSKSTSIKLNDAKTSSVCISSSSKNTVPSSEDNQSTKFEDDDDVVPSSEAQISKDHDFFSLNTDETLPKTVDASIVNEQKIEVTFASASCQEIAMKFETTDVSQSFQKPGSSKYDEPLVVESNSTYPSDSIPNNDDVLKQEPGLSEEAFLKLEGRRRKLEDINIIDVKADDQLTDKNEWLMKSLTQEVEHRPFKRRHDMPTQQQKRKHQITYLAFQAKEREMDLKNQWALNNRTRRETQAKYGF